MKKGVLSIKEHVLQMRFIGDGLEVASYFLSADDFVFYLFGGLFSDFDVVSLTTEGDIPTMVEVQPILHANDEMRLLQLIQDHWYVDNEATQHVISQFANMLLIQNEE
ncbi:hypothetical protein ACS0TY_034314 [Phlomoides rotata]